MDYSSYIDMLYRRQNYNAQDIQKNLVSREYYENIVLGVAKVLKENPDASLNELRNILIKDGQIEEKIRTFCIINKKAPGMVLSVRTNNYYHDFSAGNKQEVAYQDGKAIPSVEAMNNDDIFDLASVTKLFTGIATLKLVELGLINLNDQATKFVPQFTNLKGTTIYDLLTYKPIKTDVRIDSAKSQAEAEKILFSASEKEVGFGQGRYNDLGAMILKYVVESVTTMPYYDFLKKYILDPLGMSDTLVTFDDKQKSRVVSTNGDIRISKDGNITERTYIDRGVSSDDKARILGQPYGNLTGHAGLFSTAQDMEKLTQGFIASSFISCALRDEMARNHTGYLYTKPTGTRWATQFLGMLCYAKNPVSDLTEVVHSLSGNSFAAQGWSGTYYTVDPLNGIGVFIGSNRTHNRVSINGQRDNVTIGPMGEKYIILPNGRKVIDSSRFVCDMNYIVSPAVELALKLKIMEDIVNARDLDPEEEHSKVM